MSWVEKMGIALSRLSLLLVALFYLYFDYSDVLFQQLSSKIVIVFRLLGSNYYRGLLQSLLGVVDI